MPVTPTLVHSTASIYSRLCWIAEQQFPGWQYSGELLTLYVVCWMTPILLLVLNQIQWHHVILFQSIIFTELNSHYHTDNWSPNITQLILQPTGHLQPQLQQEFWQCNVWFPVESSQRRLRLGVHWRVDASFAAAQTFARWVRSYLTEETFSWVEPTKHGIYGSHNKNMQICNHTFGSLVTGYDQLVN